MKARALKPQPLPPAAGDYARIRNTAIVFEVFAVDDGGSVQRVTDGAWFVGAGCVRADRPALAVGGFDFVEGPVMP